MAASEARGQEVGGDEALAGQEQRATDSPDSRETRGVGIRVKVRETTRESTWTVPEDEEMKCAFFHDEQWDELHVVNKETKELLATYTRAQVFHMVSKLDRVKKRSRHCGVVSVHDVKSGSVQ